jgi:hypothetical protein
LTATGGPNQAASREEIMKTGTKLLGLTVACATCCGAFPAVVPMLAAVGFASIGTAAVGWAVGLTALAVAAVVCIAVAVRPRRVAASACATTIGNCGCRTTQTAATRVNAA